jgi:predicted acyl esterase
MKSAPLQISKLDMAGRKSRLKGPRSPPDQTTELKLDIFYPDRSGEDRKLLVYTGAPLATNVEILGSPVVVLEVASTATDGTFFAYLEDVAPDGHVTYLD